MRPSLFLPTSVQWEIIVRRSFAALGIVLLLAVAQAAAQTQPTSHERAAREFLTALGMETILREISSALANNLIRSNPPLAVHRDVIVEWSNKYVTWEAAAPELVTAYTQTFTEPELREITAFYATPTGRKMAVELPQLMENAAAAGGRLAGAHIADLEKMLRERSTKPPAGSDQAPAGSPPQKTP
jgi:hypothetical protein